MECSPANTDNLRKAEDRKVEYWSAGKPLGKWAITWIISKEIFLIELIDRHHTRIGDWARGCGGRLLEDISSHFVGRDVGLIEKFAKLVLTQFYVSNGVAGFRNEV